MKSAVALLVDLIAVVVARESSAAVGSAVAHEGSVDAGPVLTPVLVGATRGEPGLLVAPAIHLVLAPGAVAHLVAPGRPGHALLVPASEVAPHRGLVVWHLGQGEPRVVVALKHLDH